MERNLKDTKSLSKAIRFITKQQRDSKRNHLPNTNLLACCSKFILSVNRFAPLYEAEDWIKQEQVSNWWCCEETRQCTGMCGSVICTLPQRHNPSLQNVTSHSGDAWKENEASLLLSWRCMLQWQVSTLADSHRIIFRPAVLQTAGKWSRSWCWGTWGQLAVCYDESTLIVYWFTITWFSACLVSCKCEHCVCAHVHLCV